MLGKVLQIPWQPEYKRQIVDVTPFMQSIYLGSNSVQQQQETARNMGSWCTNCYTSQLT